MRCIPNDIAARLSRVGIVNSAYRAFLALAAAWLAAGLAACGGSPNRPHLAAASSSAAAPTLTQAQGAAICRDFAARLPGAFNQDQPRFNSQLRADESQAAGTQLGNGLSTLDSDLSKSIRMRSSPSNQAVLQTCRLSRTTASTMARPLNSHPERE